MSKRRRYSPEEPERAAVFFYETSTALYHYETAELGPNTLNELDGARRRLENRLGLTLNLKPHEFSPGVMFEAFVDAP